MTSHPEWPHRTLDIVELREAGWRPTPLREFVFKVHQQCNLACDYCYVYELADHTWRDRPRQMSEMVWRVAIDRIAEHVRRHDLAAVSVVLHGGEPLLAGLEQLRPLVEHLRSGPLAGLCDVQVGLQSNGTLLDRPTLDVLRGLDVRIGISLDGTASAHDRHRVNRHGQGSYQAVRTALELLSEPEYQASYSGLLCVIDPAADAVAVYESLLVFRPPVIDFLLPHANWTHPPRRDGSATPYGEWLCAAFDRWYGSPRPETRVRLFDALLRLLLGGTSGSEQIGLSPSGVVVVESDGAIELTDSLKSAYSGASGTGMHITSHSFEDAMRHPGIVARQIGLAALSDTCQRCAIRMTCGGGHYAHRYRAPGGFRNPSVYCADLQVFIAHVAGRLRTDLVRLGVGGG